MLKAHQPCLLTFNVATKPAEPAAACVVHAGGDDEMTMMKAPITCTCAMSAGTLLILIFQNLNSQFCLCMCVCLLHTGAAELGCTSAEYRRPLCRCTSYERGCVQMHWRGL